MPKKILIVDDSNMVQDLLTFMLSSSGYEVNCADSGMEALEKLNRDKYDLCIVDLNMPLMDGYTLITKIREDPYLKDVKIIIISTESEYENIKMGFEVGADLYLTKPVKQTVLVTNIKILIGE